MSSPTESNLFIVSPLAKSAEFYQQLLTGTASYTHLGNRLILLAEQAHSVRQFDIVREIGLLLSNFPIRHYQTVGYYFLAVAANSVGNGDQEKARSLFELAADIAPDIYKAKSIMSLGALAYNKGDVDSAFYFCRETIKAGGLGLTSLQALRGVAVLKGAEGYHKSAILDLERILPTMRLASTSIYLDCLNSYAVELLAVGRRQEADDIAALVTSSPFAKYYPEWNATLIDIRSLSSTRSLVTVLPVASNEVEGELVRPDPRVQITIALMKANLSRKVSLAEFGEAVNLSKYHLARLFKDQTKSSPGSYFTNLRMNQAQYLLRTSLLSIKQVMSVVGYTNRRHFLSQFKKSCGSSPSEYRKKTFNLPPAALQDPNN